MFKEVNLQEEKKEEEKRGMLGMKAGFKQRAAAEFQTWNEMRASSIGSMKSILIFINKGISYLRRSLRLSYSFFASANSISA